MIFGYKKTGRASNTCVHSIVRFKKVAQELDQILSRIFKLISPTFPTPPFSPMGGTPDHIIMKTEMKGRDDIHLLLEAWTN
jgi:hypothetical protein